MPLRVLQLPGRFRRLCATIAVGGICLGSTLPTLAQNYPLLEELNRQTQSLYQDVQGGVVRVQLPVPKWVRDAAASDDPLTKWDNVVAPAVKKTLDERKDRQLRGMPGKLDAVINPTTRPTTSPATPLESSQVPSGWKVTKTPTGETILEPTAASNSSVVLHANGSGGGADPNERPDPAGVFGGVLRPRTVHSPDFAPNNVGLLLDDDGHVLVPLYIEPETLAGAPVRVAIQDRQLTATFVGSDEKTGITILKLVQPDPNRPVGRPVRMGAAKPADGSLVMMLNPNSAAGRLAMWTGGDKDYGVVVSMDGSVAGIARYGQFLGGQPCRMVVEQLIAQGKVERAILGTRLTEIRPDHPLRQRTPELADRPALLVEEVQKDSRAEKAGLQAGDLILQLGDAPVGDLTTWAALSARPTRTQLHLLRNGSPLQLQIDLKPQSP